MPMQAHSTAPSNAGREPHPPDGVCITGYLHKSREHLPGNAITKQTLSVHPDWWCRRAPGNPLNPKRWRTFFIEFPYRDVEELNREWAADDSGRFRKRRELFWVTGNELLAIYDHAPDKLWKRVRQLENARETIHFILQSKQS
jgi:hypothetical protein